MGDGLAYIFYMRIRSTADSLGIERVPIRHWQGGKARGRRGVDQNRRHNICKGNGVSLGEEVK
jgi:hypothetical protein